MQRAAIHYLLLKVCDINKATDLYLFTLKEHAAFSMSTLYMVFISLPMVKDLKT